MRLGEECPYITPCGWCSRQEKPCEKKPRQMRIDFPIAEAKMAAEAMAKLGKALKEEAPRLPLTGSRDT